MLLWVLSVGLFILVLAAYGAGVRKQAAWGKPVLALAVIGLIAVVGYKVFLAKPAKSFNVVGGSMTATESGRAKAVAAGLKGLAPDGARALILVGYDPRQMVRAYQPSLRSWLEGLRDGLEDQTVEIVGGYGPVAVEADFLSQGISEIAEDVDIIVSMGGLPADLEDLSIYEMSTPPLVGAVFDARDTTVGLDAIRGWLQSGLIQSAVYVNADNEMTAYTESNLPKL